MGKCLWGNQKDRNHRSECCEVLLVDFGSNIFSKFSRATFFLGRRSQRRDLFPQKTPETHEAAKGTSCLQKPIKINWFQQKLLEREALREATSFQSALNINTKKAWPCRRWVPAAWDGKSWSLWTAKLRILAFCKRWFCCLLCVFWYASYAFYSVVFLGFYTIFWRFCWFYLFEKPFHSKQNILEASSEIF